MRIAVTSDLHYDTRGHLTAPPLVEELAAEVAAARPDLVVLAGDLAHGLDCFRACVACFSGVGAPVAVLAGNHDVWRDRELEISSTELWGHRLPDETRRLGAVWLEGETLRHGDVAVVGTMAWYDYSAIDPVHLPRADVETIAQLKGRLNNDASWIDWPWTDPAFAARLGERVRAQVAAVAADPSVRHLVVISHVPLLEEQLVRKPDDPMWGFSNAYFGNLTLGHALLGEPKLRAVVSGHTHCGRQALVPRAAGLSPVETHVVASDYGAPRFVLLTV